MGPKHKPAERCTIYDPVTNELITDENEILSTTLKYNIGVLPKNKIAEQDIPEAVEQKLIHKKNNERHYKEWSFKCENI